MRAFLITILFSLSGFASTERLTLNCGSFQVQLASKDQAASVVSHFDTELAIYKFSSKNVVLVAMDTDEPTRLRVSLSAQWDAKTKKFAGQAIQDAGGSQLQIENGPITCSLSK
jgi:hypothetical protein